MVQGSPGLTLRSGVIASLCFHCAFFIVANFQFGFGKFQPPVVYSVEIESGSKLGGVSQRSTEAKAKVAPPTAVQKKIEEKKPKEAESVPLKAKVMVKDEPKKKVEPVKEKKAPVVKPKEQSTVDDLDKRLASKIQRYKGESTSAGGAGFGSTGTGGGGNGRRRCATTRIFYI